MTWPEIPLGARRKREATDMAAGFKSAGAVRLLSRLEELAQAADPPRLGEYFSTYPTAAIRIQAIRHFL